MRHLIENADLKVEVSELGATLCRFIDKKSGRDIVLGYDTDEEYFANAGSNLGATIGRNANRIGNGRFTLNGQEYQLTINNNMNQLHGGGINGFAFRWWQTSEKSDTKVVMTYLSKDGEEGFPGNLLTSVSYELVGDSLIYSFSGESDADTLFNLTNHAYFNLGDKDILDHFLHITTDRYSPTDEYALTLDEVKDVSGTAYDFTKETRIGDNLAALPAGIDNNYVWENMNDKLCCELRYGGLKLSLYSDLPDMHLYTANYLESQDGKGGKGYGPCQGVALECQYYPNGINYGDKYLLPILKKGEKASHYIRYELKNVKE